MQTKNSLFRSQPWSKWCRRASLSPERVTVGCSPTKGARTSEQRAIKDQPWLAMQPELNPTSQTVGLGMGDLFSCLVLTVQFQVLFQTIFLKWISHHPGQCLPFTDLPCIYVTAWWGSELCLGISELFLSGWNFKWGGCFSGMRLEPSS